MSFSATLTSDDIKKIVLREVTMPLRTPFETAHGTTSQRRLIIIEVHAPPWIGYGEASPLEHPFYSEETVHTAWHILEDFLVPMVMESSWTKLRDIAEMIRPVRRNGMAKAGLESAFWDLAAKGADIPLADLLGQGKDRVPAGIALGIAPTVEALVSSVKDALNKGYQRVKIKIKPGWDIEPVEALREALGAFPLAVDANSSYRLDQSERLKSLDDFQLEYIEQPLNPDALIDHARLQDALATPLCLDESITSALSAQTALQLGAGRIVNLKSGRVGGLSECLTIHDLCQEKGTPLWIGGMLESGVGRAHNVALASLPGFTLPGDLSASDRYWRQDIIHPPVTMTQDGYIEVPKSPGIGFDVDVELLERLTVRRRIFPKHLTRR